MLDFYLTDEDGVLTNTSSPNKGGWISAVAPSPSEQDFLIHKIGIAPEFVRACLDEEESSYIDQDDDQTQTLVIADYPEMEQQTDRIMPSFITLPVGIVIIEKYIVTICSRENSTIQSLAEGRVKGIDTRYKTQFLLHMLLLISQEFQTYLRQIDRLSNQIEQRLYKTMKNKELIAMLELDKSLVYFSTSLKGNEMTLKKISRGRQITLYDDDKELLEDVLIEAHQAIEMCETYSSINARTSEGFTNVLNNNMNDIMKRLTVITIVLSIPNMIYGFYGMNVSDLPFTWAGFPLILSILLCIFSWLYFERNNKYK